MSLSGRQKPTEALRKPKVVSESKPQIQCSIDKKKWKVQIIVKRRYYMSIWRAKKNYAMKLATEKKRARTRTHTRYIMQMYFYNIKSITFTFFLLFYKCHSKMTHAYYWTIVANICDYVCVCVCARSRNYSHFAKSFLARCLTSFRNMSIMNFSHQSFVDGKQLQKMFTFYHFELMHAAFIWIANEDCFNFFAVEFLISKKGIPK